MAAHQIFALHHHKLNNFQFPASISKFNFFWLIYVLNNFNFSFEIKRLMADVREIIAGLKWKRIESNGKKWINIIFFFLFK